MQKIHKNSLRQKIIALRKSLSYTTWQDLSDIIINKINALPEYLAAEHVGIYFACNNEVDLSNLWQNNNQKKFYAPKIFNNQLQLLAFRTSKELILGKFNIPEPQSGAHPAPILDILFVPGVAFDKNCNRLGMGGGYYDRLLVTKPAKLVIGIAFDIQIVDKIPVDSWDIKVDKVITCSIG